MTSEVLEPSSAERAQAPSRPLVWVGRVAAFLLGVAFLVAAWTKAVDPQGFAIQIVKDGLMFESLALPAAIAVVAVEFFVAMGLVVGSRRVIILGLATLMMFGFTGLAAWQVVSPPENPESCGCFGNFVQQDPVQHLWTNIGLFALSLLAWLGRDEAVRGKLRFALALAAGVAGLVFTIAAPSLPIDEWPGVTLLEPGAEVAALPIEDLIPELYEGRHLVVVLDRAAERSAADVARLNETAVFGQGLSVHGIAEDNAELEAQFLFTAGPAFPISGAPWGMMKPLYRTLPRSFLVEDGVVVEVWQGIPNDATIANIAEASGS